VQEALVNVHRHAEATKVSIILTLDGSVLRLTISDDGKGLPTDSQDGTAAPALGVGIPGMEARIRQFGGSLKIESNSEGTTIWAVIPLTGEDADEEAA
jgi:signal transduction histidine kinase